MENLNECLKYVANELKTEKIDFSGILNIEDVINIKIAEKDLNDRWNKPLEEIKFTFMFSKVVNEKCCSSEKYLNVIEEDTEVNCIKILEKNLQEKNRNYYISTLFTTKKGYIYLPLFKISRIVKEFSEYHNQNIYYLYIKETTKDDFEEITDLDLSNKVFDFINKLRNDLITKKFFISQSAITKTNFNLKHNIHLFLLNITTSLENGSIEVYDELSNDEVDLIINNLKFKNNNIFTQIILRLFEVQTLNDIYKTIYNRYLATISKEEELEKENN